MFYSDTLPEKIITKLKEKNIYSENDKIVAFYDDTIFLTGNKGIVCTQKNLVVYNGSSISTYKLSDVKNVESREIDKEKYVYKMILTTSDGEERNITPGSIPNDEMHLLVDVINNYRNKIR